ncbi:serine hydrolase domain-containing protein [Corallococcus llansteffanensis]|uniref:Class A beta-lactamase-related serine hydrolase n=1 Tax=Corallococcus llansteffanensis TaxID=2316731 RepID=A0A3A8Q7J4_9BACT|nr:serine hydrolase domain-containing protein [Corallococcus llansteffanensis]RKH64689.1 class A beta-lactamase-related serine hydrolase [Corallococcus llansteffanensis]
MRPGLRTFAAWVAVAALLGCDGGRPAPTTLAEAVDDIVAPHVALGANVGIVVGVSQAGQRSTFSYGERRLGTGEPLTADTIFEIGSVTKAFTAVALAQMHLRGELGLDDPLQDFLPPGVRVPTRGEGVITLRHLANHTSGLPRQPTNMDTDRDDPYAGYTEERMFGFLGGYALPREPGREFEYSNAGYGLLGYALGARHGTDFETALRARVLDPLGLTHTSVTLTEAQRARLAQGYHGNRAVEPLRMEGITQGGGALKSDLDDMLTFLDAAMGVGPSPLEDAMRLTQEQTFGSFDTVYFQVDGVGLGWNLDVQDGAPIVFKNGGNIGFTAFIGFDRERQHGVVVLANSSLNPDAFTTFIGLEVLKKLRELEEPAAGRSR